MPSPAPGDRGKDRDAFTAPRLLVQVVEHVDSLVGQLGTEKRLGQISTDVYFFTSPDLSSLVLSSRPSPHPLYINTTFQTPFSVPPVHNLSSVYTTQHDDLDPERSHHSPELYAVWNAKPYLVTQAINNLERQGKTYDYVFWNDAVKAVKKPGASCGCLRRGHRN